MSAALRRGACPSLSAPMPTGDGLLVRLNPVENGISLKTLAGLAVAASRHGNGVLEVTARGSLQIRGLTPESAVQFASAVDLLGIAVRTGVPVETGPLAGLDAEEIADPSPLAYDIRSAVAVSNLSDRHGPKVSVVVDGGGRIHLDEVISDVRLVAYRDETATRWRIAVGGTAGNARLIALLDRPAASATVLALLAAIAAKGQGVRGRDLSDAEITALLPDGAGLPSPAADRAASQPIGLLPLLGDACALGIGLPFGQILADQVIGLSSAASALGATEFRLAPGRAFLVLGMSRMAAIELQAAALSLGFVTDPGDPRRTIAACPGSPACASGHLPTRAIAAAIAEAADDLLGSGMRLHVSGCAKRCAEPAAPSITLVGTAEGCELHVERDQREGFGRVANDEALAAFQRAAALFHAQKRPGESAPACFRRLGSARTATAFQQGPR